MSTAGSSSRFDWGTVRKLTFEQARQEQRDEAAHMTMPQRLAAMTELNRRVFVIAPEPANDPATAFFVRRPH